MHNSFTSMAFSEIFVIHNFILAFNQKKHTCLSPVSPPSSFTTEPVALHVVINSIGNENMRFLSIILFSLTNYISHLQHNATLDSMKTVSSPWISAPIHPTFFSIGMPIIFLSSILKTTKHISIHI